MGLLVLAGQTLAAQTMEIRRQEHAAEFTALDRDCEKLTALEVELGSYDEVREDSEGR